ncbi:MAG: MFS transporter [Betaproteobacteria bacterium]|nr:MFS transporter [Betaproteobacteria bacterium]
MFSQATATGLAAIIRALMPFARLPPIVLVLTLTTVFFIAMKGNRVVVTLFAVDLGAGMFQTGILFALHGLFPLLLAVSAGRIADRFDNRVLMYVGIAFYAIANLLPFLWPGLPALYVCATIGGFTSMLFVLATQNYIGSLSTPATRTKYFSYYAIGESMTQVLGPIVMGYAIDHWTHPYAFLLLTIVSVVTLALTYLGRGRLPHGKPKAASEGPRNRGDLLKLPAMRAALITNAVVMVGWDLYNLYMPIYMRTMGFSATTIGYVLGAYGVAAIIIRLAIPPVTARFGVQRMIAGALTVAACGFVFIPFSQLPVVLMALSFVIGLGVGCGQPLSMALAYNAAPAGRTAEAIAMRLAVSYGAHVVIPTAFGALGAAVGLKAVFWLCSGALAGGAVMNGRQAGKMDKT